jgi:hypothetical protein
MLFLTEHHTMNVYWGKGGISPRIFDLLEVSGQFHVSADLSAGKEALIPISYESGLVPALVWTRRWREKFSAPAWTRSPDHPARSSALYHWAIPAPTDNNLFIPNFIFFFFFCSPPFLIYLSPSFVIYIIRMYPKEIEWKGVDWMHLAQDIEKWRAVVNTVIKAYVS